MKFHLTSDKVVGEDGESEMVVSFSNSANLIFDIHFRGLYMYMIHLDFAPSYVAQIIGIDEI